MGKIAKKGRPPPQKNKRVAAALSPKAVPKNGETSVDVVIGAGKQCAHLEKGIDLVKLSDKIGLTEPVRCQDCRVGPGVRGKGKGKKCGSSKAIWICLECGCYDCGAVGFPTTASHAFRHFKASKHSLVMQYENPHLCWCFPCNSHVPVQKSEEDGKEKGTLFDIFKLIKRLSAEGGPKDVYQLYVGSDENSKTKTRLESNVSSTANAKGGYMVRGLLNLGNTCFFNSIVQNLMAMDKLRDYFLKLDDGSRMPLSSSFRKLFVETSFETDARNVINPKSFFGCVCSKAPQFRGYDQHDSHELLRCLLDGLCTEEVSLRKENSRQENGESPDQFASVGGIFGGQVSSTVSCMLCGHSSTVYEPFLDLSLAVPTKKAPTKKSQLVSPSRKAKPPPKRAGYLKARKGAYPDQRVSVSSNITDSSQQALTAAPNPENSLASSDNGAGLDLDNPTTVADNENSAASDSVSAVDNDPHQTSFECCDLSWLDYLDEEVLADDNEGTCQNNEMTCFNNEVKCSSQNSQVSAIRDSPKELDADEVTCQNDDMTFPVYTQNGLVSAMEDPPERDLMENGSEVIFLPYKQVPAEEKVEGDTSSFSGHGQDDLLDLDGIGDLFNEPENGVLARTSSGSEDDVDDANHVVSIESCLALFTKPEILSDEHAWHCDNCSKKLQRENKKVMKNKGKMATMNGGSCSSSHICDINSSNGLNCPQEFNASGNIKNDSDFNASGESLLLTLGKECKNNTSCSQESSSYQSCDSRSVNMNTADEIQQPEFPADELDSNCMKLKRDDAAAAAATKRFLIDKAPPILTIHLNRFSQDARGRVKKLNGHVSFQTTFDLVPFMDPRHKETDDSYNYRLIGVVEHSGSMNRGHYVAYIRGGGGGEENKDGNLNVWYYVSDSSVRQVSVKQVLGCEAYILFYEKF